MATASDLDRRAFLGRMYDQMFNDINTHILVVWQSAGVLVTAFAVLALSEKGIVPFDIATALLMLLAMWLLCHLEDASYWYNRNLIIIANIERQFLHAQDLHDIHYYFGKHRAAGQMIYHLRIQYAFGVGISAVVLLLHFATRVWPGLGASWSSFELMRAVPYLVTLAGLLFIGKLRSDFKEKYAEFLDNSPGMNVETPGIRYGKGHPAT
jgi:hypothetical protein